jgi:hypothetical protein
MAVDTPGPDAAGPDAVMMDLDVGQPWQHATAAGGPGAQAAPSGSNGSSAVTRPVLDPQLLSMRPLALDHLLVTQVRVMEAGAGARAGGGGSAFAMLSGGDKIPAVCCWHPETVCAGC